MLILAVAQMGRCLSLCVTLALVGIDLVEAGTVQDETDIEVGVGQEGGGGEK